MTLTYNDYLSALTKLRDAPGHSRAARESASRTRTEAIALADKAVAQAEERSAEAIKSIEGQLIAARKILEPLGRESSLPLHVTSNRQTAVATSNELADALTGLVRGVSALKKSVDKELADQVAERARLAQLAKDEAARLAAERKAAEQAAVAAARRRQRIIRSVVGAAALVVVLVVALVFTL